MKENNKLKVVHTTMGRVLERTSCKRSGGNGRLTEGSCDKGYNCQ